MRALVDAGMDVARMNFSHGSHSDHKQVYDLVRSAAAESGRSVGILADLQGPKIRLGTFANGAVEWNTGDIVRITVEDVAGTHDRVSTTYKGLARDAKPGDRLLVDDGKVGLVVKGVEGPDVVCEVTEGGPVSNNKGVSLPGMDVSVPALSEKDIEDLEFALQLGVDFIALSFVRSPADIDLVHQIMDRAGKGRLPVVAKIEKPEAVYNLEAIVLAFDAVMVARGDLGVEMAPEKVPVIQKHVIRRASVWRKPVITATQMLESMIENPRPTRAEASDVANAIFDGTDAVMLSAETASGQYPRESVSIMSRIAIEAECNMDDFVQFRRRRREHRGLTIAETICESIAHAAEDLPMGAIAVFTETGNTVRMISKFRPPVAIYAYTHSAPVVNRMNLYWGVHPVRCRQAHSAEQMVTMAEQDLVRRGLLKPADVLGVVAGTRQASGSTNLMRLHVVTSEEAESIAQKKPAPKKPRSKKSHAQK